jgi:hypothetical protein
LLWKRGRAFPLSRLESRFRCPRYGSREVRVLFEPLANVTLARDALVDGSRIGIWLTIAAVGRYILERRPDRAVAVVPKSKKARHPARESN